MPKVASLEEINQMLAGMVGRREGMDQPYKLNRMLELMDYLGNPQNKLKVIHITGTSGKTSTSYYVAAMLGLAGKKVGLTVSPHVSKVSERLQVNLEELTENEYCQVFSEFLKVVNSSDIKPTYFEFLVAMAYWYFAKEQVDYAVVEVGLGGLLDGTNVIDRQDKVCVITDIGLDHTSVLGTNVSNIAKQKAGIIGDHNVVLTHPQAAQIMQAIKDRCAQQHGQLLVLEEDDYLAAPGNLPLFQRRNWTLAKETANYLAKRDNFELTNAQLVQTAELQIPGRMDVTKLDNKTLILDGAHNPQKLEALSSSIKEKFPNQKIAAMVALAGHKEQFKESLTALSNLADHTIFTSFRVGQDEQRSAIDSYKLAELARQLGYEDFQVEPDPEKAYKLLLDQKEPILLVTGSLYLVSRIQGVK